MIEQFTVEVPAPGGNRERTAYLCFPKDYDGDKRYPVLYMFDGQTLFFDETAPYGDSWRMGEALDGLGAQLIVAAVDCDPNDRLTEYSPFPFASKFGSSEGKGGVYLDWLTQTFIPIVESRCSADPARRFLAGSSMGGLMTLFGLMRHPDVFRGGAALSPSLWIDPKACGQMCAQIKQRPLLYMDYGTKELKNHGERQRAALRECLDALIGQNVPLTFRLIGGGEHSEKTWRAQIPVFLSALGLI